MSVAHKLLTLAEVITRREINAKLKPRIKYPLHPKAVTSGRGMSVYVDLVKDFCNFIPNNIFEIGANYGQDAEYLRRSFSVKPELVYAFEPHPQIAPEIKRYYSFNVFDFAVSNQNGQATFNVVDVCAKDQWNTGISSLRTHISDAIKYNKITVETRRMDGFIVDQAIETIDFLKIDVEGVNYEVLEGFGEKLPIVKAIQIEGENIPYWNDQKLFSDIETLLRKNNFVMVYFILSSDAIQSDSFWVQKKYLKNASKYSV